MDIMYQQHDPQHRSLDILGSTSTNTAVAVTRTRTFVAYKDTLKATAIAKQHEGADLATEDDQQEQFWGGGWGPYRFGFSSGGIGDWSVRWRLMPRRPRRKRCVRVCEVIP